MKLNVCLFIVSAIALASCVDIPDYSNVPEIAYNGINQRLTEDSVGGKLQKLELVTLTIDFKDGDGDLGVSSNSLQDSMFRKAYEKVPNWGHQSNYELITMAPNPDGKTWREYVLSEDSFKWFQDLKPDGKPGPIKGKLDLDIRLYYSPSGNTVVERRKYKVRIIDRAFHISNTSEPSDEVLVPVPRE